MSQLSRIPVYIVNLKYRTDRREFSINQFAGRQEFDVTIVDACEDEAGAIGLWKSLCGIIKTAMSRQQEYILFCEDDHQFTDNYTPDILFAAIAQAKEKNAGLLSGGVSWFDSGIPVSENICWISDFTGLQFTVIFSRLYHLILEAPYTGEGVDYKLATFTDEKYCIFPFISVQKDFGYSDVTIENNAPGKVDALFEHSIASMKTVLDVKEYFDNRLLTTELVETDNICIPTYIINLEERIERKSHIIDQFRDKPEFEVRLVNACKHEPGAVGLWLSIRKVIEMAIANKDDVIIICEDDHQFTSHYNKDYLFHHIILAHQLGIEYLSGGSGGVYRALPVSDHLFWGANFLSTQFIILYQSIFQRILDEPFDDEVTADIYLSRITSAKLVLYPFVSGQKDFGYSDVTSLHNMENGLVQRLFAGSNRKLSAIQQLCMPASVIAKQI